MDPDELYVRAINAIEELVVEHGYSRSDIENLVDNAFENAGAS